MEYHLAHLIYAALVVFSAWITGVQMRRKMKRALKRDVSDLELTSLNLWMRIKAEEEKK